MNENKRYFSPITNSYYRTADEGRAYEAKYFNKQIIEEIRRQNQLQNQFSTNSNTYNTFYHALMNFLWFWELIIGDFCLLETLGLLSAIVNTIIAISAMIIHYNLDVTYPERVAKRK